MQGRLARLLVLRLLILRLLVLRLRLLILRLLILRLLVEGMSVRATERTTARVLRYRKERRLRRYAALTERG